MCCSYTKFRQVQKTETGFPKNSEDSETHTLQNYISDLQIYIMRDKKTCSKELFFCQGACEAQLRKIVLASTDILRIDACRLHGEVKNRTKCLQLHIGFDFLALNIILTLYCSEHVPRLHYPLCNVLQNYWAPFPLNSYKNVMSSF